MRSIFLVWLLVGCIDQPNPVRGPGQTQIAIRLSEMGLYVGQLSDLTPAPGIVPYDVNVSLYSDLAEKQRFVWLPPGTSFGATDDRWDVPDGTYFIKNFFYPLDARDPTAGRRLVETRLLITRGSGLDASTYIWNNDQTDALVSGGNEDVRVQWIDETGASRDDKFHVPGTSLCSSCHSDRPLGWRTRQQPSPHVLVESGLLDHDPPAGITLSDPYGTASLDVRARSYLDANCSHCHGAGGEAEGTGVLFDFEHTDMASLPLCRSTEPVGGNKRVIVPGRPEQSGMISRLLSDDPFIRMPRGPSRIPDPKGVPLLREWIEAMPGGCP